jgi:DNA-binding transcriptional LysR family regulator
MARLLVSPQVWVSLGIMESDKTLMMSIEVIDDVRVTLDQLRVLVAVADSGGFSAAARRLGRVQSAVSHAVAALESQLGLVLFDRAPHRPVLTGEGRLLLAAARRALEAAAEVVQAADAIAGGLEPEVGLAVDALLPEAVLVGACRDFAAAYPTVRLRLEVDTLSSVAARVRDGVIGPAARADGLERRHLLDVRMVPVAAPGHPLARRRGRLPTAALAAHVQIVLSERAPGGQSPDEGVLSPHTWRVADLGTKQALLVGGLGWGSLPEHRARPELRRGRLRRLRPAAWSDDQHLLPLAVAHRPERRLGPAARWLIDHLAGLCAEVARQSAAMRPMRPER